jgi:hypothetical protein
MEFSNFPTIQDEIDCLRKCIMPEQKGETPIQRMERTTYNDHIVMKLSKLLTKQKQDENKKEKDT